MKSDLEKKLTNKNEFLASFAIAKAENSSLTLQEAEEVYNTILQNEKELTIKNKSKNKKKIVQNN